MNSLPIDSPLVTPIKTKVMLGGIKMPSVPDAATTPIAYRLSYPLATMAGISVPPTAAAVAGLDPDIAAHSAHAAPVTSASPPVSDPRAERRDHARGDPAVRHDRAGEHEAGNRNERGGIERREHPLGDQIQREVRCDGQNRDAGQGQRDRNRHAEQEEKDEEPE